MEIKEKIKNWVKGTFGIEEDFAIEHPDNIDFGDYSVNVAMVLAKKNGKNPVELAKEFGEKLNDKKLKEIKEIKVVGGFINLFLKQEFFTEALLKISEGKDLPQNLVNKKYIVEHTQPNPFKEFHIGHLMNNAIGESISRLIKTCGADTKVVSYHGDVGLHVAKAVWALKKGVDFKSAYSFGHEAYENSEESKNEIIEINKKIYDKSDPEINSLYESGREKSLENFESIYKRLDSGFDEHFYENQSAEIGKRLVEENLGKVFEKGEKGAIIFKGEDFEPKTHTRVFLNSEGLPTYEAKELGLAEIKLEKFGDYDKSITITANEQDSFFKVVEVAVGEILPKLKGKLAHLSHGVLKLPSGKMSSRIGNIITAENLIEEVKVKVIEKIKDREFSDKEKDEIAEKVAFGAIKYTILHQTIGKDIIFDFEKSLSFEGDSGPYLQYATVRAKSILEKAKGINLEINSSVPESWQTIHLEKILARFYEVIERSMLSLTPHLLVNYLIEVAGEFNSFYGREKIVDEEDKTSSYKLFLTKVVSETLASGLWLLGIKTPDRM